MDEVKQAEKDESEKVENQTENNSEKQEKRDSTAENKA